MSSTYFHHSIPSIDKTKNATDGIKVLLQKKKKTKKQTTTKSLFFSVEVSYEPVGCYRDDASRRGKNRALETLVKSFRGNAWIWSKWPDMTAVIQSCAEEAFASGYKMVGIQFYAECWSSKQAEQKYDIYKTSKNCINGVGKRLANFVYRVSGKILKVLFSGLL